MEDAGKRWARSYSQEQAQFFKLEAAFGQRPEGQVFPHFINELNGSLCLSFTISGTSPSPLRSPGQTQPPYSRVETHGRRVTSWSPLGFRTDEEEERGVGKICVQVLPLPQMDVWTVQRQSGIRVLVTNGWKEASPRRPVELSGCVSVHVVKFTSFSCPGDIKERLIQSQGRIADACRREGLGGIGSWMLLLWQRGILELLQNNCQKLSNTTLNDAARQDNTFLFLNGFFLPGHCI